VRDGLSLLIIPVWAFGGGFWMLLVGSFVMQMGVQGAWGVIPVHLNELSADAARGLMPGVGRISLGFCWRRRPIRIQYKLKEHFGYQWAVAGFEIVTIVVLLSLLVWEVEQHSRSFTKKVQGIRKI